MAPATPSLQLALPPRGRVAPTTRQHLWEAGTTDLPPAAGGLASPAARSDVSGDGDDCVDAREMPLSPGIAIAFSSGMREDPRALAFTDRRLVTDRGVTSLPLAKEITKVLRVARVRCHLLTLYTCKSTSS